MPKWHFDPETKLRKQRISLRSKRVSVEAAKQFNLERLCVLRLGSSMVEHPAVNRQVVGSSPTLSAIILSRDGAVWQLVGLITRRSQVQILLPQPCGEVAQLARAFGSYPECQRFKSVLRYQIRIRRKPNPSFWLHGQVVKTQPSQGCIMGSNPIGVTKHLTIRLLQAFY